MSGFYTKLDLPERSNTFFEKMSGLLSQEIYNVGSSFMVQQLTKVGIEGRVTKNSVVKVFINNQDQSPVPDIVADANGYWSSTITLYPGQNTIQVQFYAPELSSATDAPFSPALSQDYTLIHPTLFSKFTVDLPLRQVLLDGNNLYMGGIVGTPNHYQSMAVFDITTGIGTILRYDTGSVLAGDVKFMTMDSNWVYSAQEMGNGDQTVSRYAKDLSARTGTIFSTQPGCLYADGTNLFAARFNGTSATLLSKIDPTNMTVSSEISVMPGNFNEFAYHRNNMAEDGSGNILIPASSFAFSDFLDTQIQDGTPGLGASTVLYTYLYHSKVNKTTMVRVNDYWSLIIMDVTTQPYGGLNSMVRYGGYYYTVVQANPGRVVQLQEQTIDTYNYLVPIGVTPLPFSTILPNGDSTLPPIMALGPDNRLYVTANGHVARFTPGATSEVEVMRGTMSVAVTGTDMALIDDMNADRAVAGPLAIFTDRGITYPIVAPAIPTNLRCHYSPTYGECCVAWNPVTDGAAVIVEKQINGAGWTEVGRQYFTSGYYVSGSGVGDDVFDFRVKAFNGVGESAYSALATVTVPFLQPPIADPVSLTVTSHTALTVSLQWTDQAYGGGHIVKIYRKASTDLDFSVIYSYSTSGPQIKTYVDTTAQAGTSYDYKIRNSHLIYAPSNFSNVVSVTTNPILDQSTDPEVLSTALINRQPDLTMFLNIADASQYGPGANQAIMSVGIISGNMAWACVGTQADFAGADRFIYKVDYTSHTVIRTQDSAHQMAYDGSNLWTVTYDGGIGYGLHKKDPQTLSDLAYIGGGLTSVYWDGSNLWTLKTNGVVQKVDRTGLTFTDIGPTSGSTDAVYGMVKIGGYLYALTNNDIYNNGGQMQVTKINIVTLAVAATYNYGVGRVKGLYTDGTYLYMMSDSVIQAWVIDPATGAMTGSINSGISISHWAPLMLVDGDGWTYGHKTVPKTGSVYYDGSSTLFNEFHLPIADNGTNLLMYELIYPSYTVEMARFPEQSYDAIIRQNPVAMPISGTPGGLSALAVGETVHLTWTSDDGRAMIRIERSANGGPYQVLATQPPSPMSYVDNSPPGNMSLMYRVYSFTTGGDSVPASVVIASPISDQDFQIADVGVDHVAYAKNGTDTWAAWSFGSTINARKITSGLVATDYTLETGNVGGKVLRLLCDGTNLYTVTVGNPVRIRKYDLSGNFVAMFSYATVIKDTAIGAGFIWFTDGVNIRKVLTSDMTTNTVFHSGNNPGGQPFITLGYEPNSNTLTGLTNDGNTTYAHQFSTADAFLQRSGSCFALPVSGMMRGAWWRYAGNNYDYFHFPCYDWAAGQYQIGNDAIQNYFYISSGTWSTGTPYIGVCVDSTTKKMYFAAAGKIGESNPFPGSINDSRTRNVASGFEDEIVHVGSRVFVTVTDVGSPSGYSIKSVLM